MSGMIGRSLGPYTIEAELGSGGMGTVYRATGPDGLVALKVVHPHLLATPGFFKRFLREAEIGKAVRHENVIRTLDVDALLVDDKQVNYMVLEYVQGKSLRDLLNDLGTIPETLLREIARQTAAGLAAIHEAGIIHRDIKPENILITDDHEIRIMDLGVAKLQEATIELTREGHFAGSLLYAAPEQFRGDVEVGPASDLYSLGVLLYELATGENPFRRVDASQVIDAHLHFEPRMVHDTNTETTRFLAQLVACLLAKDPAKRFDSAGALHLVLEEAERSTWWTTLAPALDRKPKPKIRVRRETQLHGRSDDLQRLRQAWEKARSGEGNTVWIDGEAGIGKTRLLADFLDSVEEDAHVLYGSYPPSGGMGGFSDAVLGKFGRGLLAGAITPYLAETPSLVPAFAAMVRHEPLPPGADPLRGEALQAAAVHIMRALAAEKPTIWVLDDLHFAPQESRDLALAMARAVEDHAVLLVLTARPGVAQEDFSRLGNFRKQSLARLGGRDIVRLLTDAFRSDDLAERLAGKIALKSDGVPFFVFEMIRGLEQGNFITRQDDGSFHLTRVVDEIEVPSAVKDLIEARMRGLSADERAILDVGAVCGMSFDPDLVASVLEEKRVRVLRALAEIERRHGLVRDDGSAVRFDQNQIQEVLYLDVTPHLRAEYHTLLAEAYKGDDPVFLAHHHLHGSRPHDARPHVEPALARLAESYRNEALLDLATRALDVDGVVEGAERVEVLLKCASVLDLLGRRDEQRAVTSEAVAVADESGDDLVRGKARRALGVLLDSLSEHDRALEVLRTARELARATGDRKGEASAMGALGNVFLDLGRYAEAQEQQERRLALSREIGDRKGEASATGNLGNVLHALGRAAEALELHERQCALCRELGDRRGEAGASNNVGLACRVLGRAEEAQEHFERCRVLSREIGFRKGETIATGNLGTVFADSGRLAEARVHFERYRALSREIGSRRSEAVAVTCLGNTYMNLGRYAEAQDLNECSLAICLETGDRLLESHARHNLAAVAEVTKGDAEAARLYEEALAQRRELGAKHLILQTLLDLGRVRSDPELLDEAVAIARELGNPAKLVGALLERARLPGGDVDAALAAAAAHEGYLGRAEHFRLWQLTGDEAHLAAAKRELDDLVRHAPEQDREAMFANITLNREIRDAG